MPKRLWSDIKLISQQVGYTERTRKRQDGRGVRVKVPEMAEIIARYRKDGLHSDHLFRRGTDPTPDGQLLLDYFEFRAEVLNEFVQQQLMDSAQAREAFEAVRSRVDPLGKIALPMNKQKGDKKAVNYLTGIVILLIKEVIEDARCDFDPRILTTITRDGRPIRTLSRRADGAFPSPVDPIVIWEIKEYYFTTTFGSRVADGIYETLLDGLELEDLRQVENRKVLHYLMVDAYQTWWKDGRSYLCRLIDMLHAGYVDEILFGREVLARLPELARQWLVALDEREH